MVIDSSAVVAILLRENNYLELLNKILIADIARIPAPILVECTIVLSYRMKQDARVIVRDFIDELEIQISPFGVEQYSCAVDAFLRFGKGKHEAALNFGDCLSYALAQTLSEPLLFVGEDFSKTDILSI